MIRKYVMLRSSTTLCPLINLQTAPDKSGRSAKIWFEGNPSDSSRSVLLSSASDGQEVAEIVLDLNKDQGSRIWWRWPKYYSGDGWEIMVAGV